ncbi:MAG: tetratricopeptide repeat protein [Anaerolineae bacterium]
MDTTLQLFLLRKQPEVRINGTAYPLQPRPMKLLALIGDKGESTYFRDELILLVDGNRENRRNFRQILYLLRQQLPVEVLERESDDFIHVNHDSLWVDTREFTDRANALLSEALIFTEKEFAVGKDILSLYAEPFLMHFPTASVANREFVKWQHSRRSELASLQQQLLDRMTSYCLKHETRWGEAQQYAEQWAHSEKAGLKPLQVLIWLAIQQHSQKLPVYLDELRQREEAGELPMGRAWKEWERDIRRNHPLPLAELFPLVPQVRPSSATYPDIERTSVLEEVLSLLTTPRENQVFGLVGLPGSGKTEMAQTAAAHLRTRNPDANIVRVELPTQLDFEMVINNLLADLGRQDLLPLDYGSKRQRLKQLVQTPHLVIIVDEGYSSHLADASTLKTVLDLLEGARVMLVARTLPGFDIYEVPLPGLDEDQTRSFLVKRLGWMHESEDALFKTLAVVTAGLPLMLNIIASGLRSQRGRTASLLQYLQDDQHPELSLPAIFTRYEHVLDWLWQYLSTPEKNVLFAISLFAPETGVTTNALEDVLGSLLRIQIPPLLRQLVEMRLVKQTDSLLNGARFSLHPIVLEFVKQRNPTVSHYAKRIQQEFVRYQLGYAHTYAAKYDRLDDHQQNLLLMFEWVVMSDQYAALQTQAISLLNQLYPYFERRGLYGKVYTLLTHVRDQVQLAPAVRLQTLFYIGKLANIQAKFDLALESFQEALEIAQSAQITDRYGSLYYYLGDTYMRQGQYAEALASFGQAEAQAQHDENTTLLYASWSNMAVCHFYQSHYELARQNYERVAQHLGTDFDSLPPALKPIAQHNQNAIGSMLGELGLHEEALQNFQHSLELARDLNAPDLIGSVYLNLGVAYYFLKNYDMAQDCFTQAQRIAKEIQHTILLADVLWNQGALASARFSHRDAFQLLRTAMILVEDNHLAYLKPRVLTAFGKAYLRAELFDLAAFHFAKALSEPSISLKYAAHAVYGLILSSMMKTEAVGNNQVGPALHMIETCMKTIPTNTLEFFTQPAEIAVGHLEVAARTLQGELDHLPMLSRYRIVEAFRRWFSSRTASQASAL